MKHRSGQRQKPDNKLGAPPPPGGLPHASGGTPLPSISGSGNSRLEKLGAEIAELRLRLAKLAAERNRKPKGS